VQKLRYEGRFLLVPDAPGTGVKFNEDTIWANLKPGYEFQ
jgi:hypothetical protein